MKNISGVGSVVQSYLKESPEDLDYSPKKGLKEEISPRLEEQPDIVQDLSKKVIFNYILPFKTMAYFLSDIRTIKIINGI